MKQKLIEPSQEDFVRLAQKEEAKYKKQIPKEFYEQVEWALKDIAEGEAIVDRAIEKHVVKLYVILRKADIPPDAARHIATLKFLPYRHIRTIDKAIPKEAKNQKMADLVRIGNEKRKQQKVEAITKSVEKFKRGLPHNQAVKFGTKGGEHNLINNGVAGLKWSGSKGGKETMEKKSDEIIMIEAVKAGIYDEIIIELPEKSHAADQIRDLWASFHKAHLIVNMKGEILRVENLDRTERQEKKLEKPLTN
jgi:hypothetical protein